MCLHFTQTGPKTPTHPHTHTHTCTHARTQKKHVKNISRETFPTNKKLLFKKKRAPKTFHDTCQEFHKNKSKKRRPNTKHYTARFFPEKKKAPKNVLFHNCTQKRRQKHVLTELYTKNKAPKKVTTEFHTKPNAKKQLTTEFPNHLHRPPYKNTRICTSATSTVCECKTVHCRYSTAIKINQKQNLLPTQNFQFSIHQTCCVKKKKKSREPIDTCPLQQKQKKAKKLGNTGIYIYRRANLQYKSQRELNTSHNCLPTVLTCHLNTGTGVVQSMHPHTQPNFAGFLPYK